MSRFNFLHFFRSLQLLRCAAITIFELDRHLSDETTENSGKGISEKLSHSEIAIVRILSDLLSGMLNAFLMPVYTLKQVPPTSLYNIFLETLSVLIGASSCQ